MKSSIEDFTAVLLCGGKGERLRPLTEHLPKPLVPLHGKPILHHLITYLHEQGVRRFRVCVGYKAETVVDFAGEMKSRLGWDIECVDSGDAAMSDRVLDAGASGRVLVCYGDTLANVDLKRMLREHLAHLAWATVALYPLVSPFGIVDFDAGARVTALKEKPRLPHWINIGFVLLEREALSLMKRGADMVEYLSTLRASGRLYAYKHEGGHLTVNTEKELKDAEAHLVDFFTVLS